MFSRIIETILKGVVFYYVSFLQDSYTDRSSYLLYNKDKHCGFVIFLYSADCFEVTQTAVVCLKKLIS